MWQSKVFSPCGLVPFCMKGTWIWNHWDGMSQRWTLVICGAGQTHTLSLSSKVRKIEATLCVLERKSWIQNQELIQLWDERGGRGEKGCTGSEVVKLPLRVTRAAAKVRVVDMEPTAQRTWSSFQKPACKLLHSLRVSENVSLTSQLLGKGDVSQRRACALVSKCLQRTRDSASPSTSTQSSPETLQQDSGQSPGSEGLVWWCQLGRSHSSTQGLLL